MRELTQAEWHRIAASDGVIEINGLIVGIIEGGMEIIFSR